MPTNVPIPRILSKSLLQPNNIRKMYHGGSDDAKTDFQTGDPVAHCVKHWPADHVVLSSIPGGGFALLTQPFIITLPWSCYD